MSESIYDPSDDGIDLDDVVDLDQAFGDDEVDDMLDTSYSPPDHEPVNTRFGTTLEEEHRGETLDQRLAQEVPDPALAADLRGEDVDAESADADAVDDSLDPDDVVPYEVGDLRAGRLVAPDEGAHADLDKDLVGRDVGIDAGAASAEEAAMHVIDG